MLIWLNKLLGRVEERKVRASPTKRRRGPAWVKELVCTDGTQAQAGAAGTWALVVVVCLALLLSIAVPLMLSMGLLGYIAVAFFKLPGIVQGYKVIMGIYCTINGSMEKIFKVGTGVLGNIKKVAKAGAKAVEGIAETASDGLRAIPGVGNTLSGMVSVGGKVFSTPLDAVNKASDLMAGGIKLARSLSSFVCQLQALVKDLDKRGYKDSFAKAIDCANWDESRYGPLSSQANSTEDGKPKYCVEGDAAGDKSNFFLPPWLVDIYKAAGDEHNVPWEVLAAINLNDTNLGQSEWVKGSDETGGRVGWIPMSEKEWKDTAINDSGGTSPRFYGSPYNGKRGYITVRLKKGQDGYDPKQPIKRIPVPAKTCPIPLDVDGNQIVSGDGGGVKEAGGKYDFDELVELWTDAGGPAGDTADTAAAVALAESEGDPDAKNPSGASGLWQILGAVVEGDLFDPKVNAKNAVKKWKDAGGFSPWVAFTDGKHTKYMPKNGGSTGSSADPKSTTSSASTSAGGGDKSGLKGPFTGVSTYYDPSAGGINGREGGGSYVPTFTRGWSSAKLGNTGQPSGWNYPKDNQAYHGWLLRVTNTENGKTIEVPVGDIGPGGPPENGKERVLDLLPAPSSALTGGKPGTVPVKIEPLRKLSREETAAYARGDKKGGATSGVAGDPSKQSVVSVSLSSDDQYDTCDPVDSIFGLAQQLSARGAAGSAWREALKDVEGVDGSETADGGGPLAWPTNPRGTVIQGSNQAGGTHDPNSADFNNWQSDNALDIGVPKGSDIIASADGTITRVGGDPGDEGRAGGGNVYLKTGEQEIFYTHLSAVDVKAGQKVSRGDVIGKSGIANTVPHLHIGLIKGKPETLFGATKSDSSAPLADAVKPPSSNDGGFEGENKEGEGANACFEEAREKFPKVEKMLEEGPISLKTCLRGIQEIPVAECLDRGYSVATLRHIAGVSNAAGATFEIQPALLQALSYTTSKSGCDLVASDGRRGWAWMQDDDWKTWQVDADGGGALRNVSVDALFGAARMLRAEGAKDDPKKALQAFFKGTDGAEGLVARTLDHFESLGGERVDEAIRKSSIGSAVQRRDYRIDEDLTVVDKQPCKGVEVYAECIANLYNLVVAEYEKPAEEAEGDASALGGGCGEFKGDKGSIGDLPDLKSKPVDLGAKKVEKNTERKNINITDRPTYGRKDAQMATVAVIKAFQDCFPEYKKDWKKIKSNDWGAEFVAPKFGLMPNGHQSHRNGADNDFTIIDVTSFELAGQKYDRKKAIVLAALFLRAGANTIYFDDPEVQEFFRKNRAKELKEHPEYAKKYKAWNPNPIDWAYSGGAAANNLHHNHFHVRWYTGAGNAFPTEVKVYLGDGAKAADEELEESAPKNAGSECRRRNPDKSTPANCVYGPYQREDD